MLHPSIGTGANRRTVAGQPLIALPYHFHLPLGSAGIALAIAFAVDRKAMKRLNARMFAEVGAVAQKKRKHLFTAQATTAENVVILQQSAAMTQHWRQG